MTNCIRFFNYLNFLIFFSRRSKVNKPAWTLFTFDADTPSPVCSSYLRFVSLRLILTVILGGCFLHTQNVQTIRNSCCTRCIKTCGDNALTPVPTTTTTTPTTTTPAPSTRGPNIIETVIIPEDGMLKSVKYFTAYILKMFRSRNTFSLLLC